MSAVSTQDRIARRFAALRDEGRAGLITFITAGDPDHETSAALLAGLAHSGADLIELGMPFTDPMADGPAIQASSLRALNNGARMTRTLDLVRGFRTRDANTPIILMGYYNPIHAYGVDRFLTDAKAAGVDGLIVVDLPPEEDSELCLPALEAGVAFIRLATPTTDDARLKRHTALPVAVGFGIKTPVQAAEVARVADAAVVGSAIVTRITDNLDEDGKPRPGLVDDVMGFVRDLAAGVRGARV